MGPALSGSLLIFFLIDFLVNVAGVPAGLAGSVLLIGKIWDAFTDPVMGWLTDKTRSRIGRRLPWMIGGTLPLAIAVSLQWYVPGLSEDPDKQQMLLFWYYVGIGILMQTMFTVTTVPYYTLTAELTHDYDERTNLNGYRFSFSLAGNIIGLLMAQGLFALFAGDSKMQYLSLGLASAGLIVLFMGWCIAGVWKPVQAREAERLRTTTSRTIPFFEQIKIAFSHKPFLMVCMIYLFSWLAVQLTGSVLQLYVMDWMGLERRYFPMVAIAVQGTALLLLPVWSRLSERFGKRRVYMAGSVIWIGAQIGLVSLQPGSNTLMFILAVLAGVGVSTAYLIPWSMIPDIIELDELNTGQRREGVFYGFMVLLQKIGLAVGLGLSGWLLDLAGYIEKTEAIADPTQPDSALFALRLIVGPVPMVFLILGIITAWRYPITREKHQEILDRLAERRGKTETE